MFQDDNFYILYTLYYITKNLSIYHPTEHQFGILNNCVYNKKLMEVMFIIFFSLKTN